MARYANKYGLTEPTPVIATHSRLTGETSDLVVTTHRTGGAVITDPEHGKNGWCEGQLVIYCKEWSPQGWYLQRDYQILRVINTDRIDYRVMPPSFYPPSEHAGNIRIYMPPSPVWRDSTYSTSSRIPQRTRRY